MRRIFSPLSIASLVLCLATVALWVRSHSIVDIVYYHDARTFNQATAGTKYELLSSGGRLTFFTANWSHRLVPNGTHPRNVPMPDPADPRWTRSPLTGLHFHSCPTGQNDFDVKYPLYPSQIHSGSGFYRLPLAIPAFLLALHPIIQILRYALTPSPPGLCPACHYDVRAQLAHPDPRCPECGTPLPTPDPLSTP